MNSQRTPLPNGRFREFEIVDVIGYGGSSLCYLVKRGHAFFIMKELYPYELSTNLIRSGFLLTNNPTNSSNVEKLMEQFKDDFLHEAEISKDLAQFRRTEDLMGDNPYFFNLEIQFAVEDSLSYYLVYQSKQGRTLFEYFIPSADNYLQRALSVLNLMKQLAEAVIEIHEYGYLHLDLKLDNIYVIAFRSPVVVLLDLGSALKLKHVHDVDADHLIRRISYAEQYSSSRLHRIYHLKRRMYHLLSLSYSAEQVEVHRQEILSEIAKLNESEDVYSLYVILFELLTGSIYKSEMLDKGVFGSQNLAFSPDSVRVEVAKRISIGVYNENRTTAQFVNDIEEIRGILLSDGIHPALLRVKSKSHFEKRQSELKYEIHKGIFTELEKIEADKTFIYDNLMDYFQQQYADVISNNVLFLGEGGSGKSTQLIQLWKWLLDVKENVIPFYIPIIEFQGRHYSHLIDYILHYYSGHFTDNRRDRLLKLFEEDQDRHYVVLLDGFNESTEKEVLYGQIVSLSQFSRVKLIITSRYTFSGYLGFVTLSVRDLKSEQVSKYSKEFGISDLDNNELYKNPMMLTLVCKSNYYLKGDLISKKDLEKLNILSGSNRMEMISNFFSAQKIKHFLDYNHIWDDERVVLRLIAYDIVLPQIARIMFELKDNSIAIEDLVNLLLDYFQQRRKWVYKCSLMKKIYTYERVISLESDFIHNVLIIDLLCEELSILHFSDRISFISEVYQDFFLAYKLSAEIKSPDEISIPLLKIHLLGYEPLKNIGQLLRENRFANPMVSSRGVSDVERFLDKYRKIFDGSTSLLVQNAVELMRIARNGLILADLSYLDLTKSKLTGSLFSTVGEIDSEPANFRGSHFSKIAFRTVEHRASVDRIVVSDNAKYVTSYSSIEGVSRTWDIDTKEYLAEFKGKMLYSEFFGNQHLLSFDGSILYIHDPLTGLTLTSITVESILDKYGLKHVSLVKIMGIIGFHVFLGVVFTNDNNQLYLKIIKFDLSSFNFLQHEDHACISMKQGSIYGINSYSKERCIFDFNGNTFIIKLFHKGKYITRDYSKIEIHDITTNTIIGSIYAKIVIFTTFFYLESQNSIVFSVFSSDSKYLLVQWNLKNKSVKIVDEHKRMVNVLGVCGVTGTIFKNAGYYIEALRFVRSNRKESKIPFIIKEIGYRHDDVLSDKFYVNHGISVFLMDSERAIAKIDNKTANLIASCQIYRDGNFVGLRCIGNQVYIVFPRKMYVFSISHNRCSKSLFERGSNNHMFGHEEFEERERFVQNSSSLLTPKKVFALTFEHLYNTSKPMYSDRWDNTRLNSREVSFNYKDESQNQSFRFFINYFFKQIVKFNVSSKESLGINLSSYMTGDETISLIFGAQLFLMQKENLVVVELNSLQAKSYQHHIFDQDEDLSDKRRKYLCYVHVFAYVMIQSTKLVMIVDGNRLCVLKIIGTQLITILDVQEIVKACFSRNSLYAIDTSGKLLRFDVSESYENSDQATYNTNYLPLYISEMSLDKESMLDMKFYQGKIFIVLRNMTLIVWNEEKNEIEGRFEFLDTNILNCDFVDSIGFDFTINQHKGGI